MTDYTYNRILERANLLASIALDFERSGNKNMAKKYEGDFAFLMIALEENAILTDQQLFEVNTAFDEKFYEYQLSKEGAADEKK